ncbi:hypothetical protein B5807_00370 [Epicoccum nigrum]|uniref:Uncharacterized protein n=1 Tax=Epicoccum nigrum TaxID=105696 RepID=A0A1Y2MD34_EPING|nr:hypothetical protein B5807_00370 [Epicoccum nigrum]
MASTSTKMEEHMSICAQDPNSPVVKYKPRKLNRLLHPRSSKSDHAGRQDPEANKMRQNARNTEDASKQSWESRRSQDRKSSEASQ